MVRIRNDFFTCSCWILDKIRSIVESCCCALADIDMNNVVQKIPVNIFCKSLFIFSIYVYIQLNRSSMIRIIICLLLSFSFFSIIVAQDKEQKFRPDSGLVVLTVNSGEEFVGTILAEDAREVSIRLQNGKMLIIPAYTVKSIRKLSSSTLIKGKPVFANPHPSRYFYTPSAIPMDKGEVYIKPYMQLLTRCSSALQKIFRLAPPPPLSERHWRLLPSIPSRLMRKIPLLLVAWLASLAGAQGPTWALGLVHLHMVQKSPILRSRVDMPGSMRRTMAVADLR